MPIKLNYQLSGGDHFKRGVTGTKHHSLCAGNCMILMIAFIWML